MEGTSFQPAIPSFTSLSIHYFNVRSHLPKFDELAAIAEALQPTVICIVETWVSDKFETVHYMAICMMQGEYKFQCCNSHTNKPLLDLVLQLYNNPIRN